MGDIAGHQEGMTAKAPGECRGMMGIKTCLECPLEDCYYNNGLKWHVEQWQEEKGLLTNRRKRVKKNTEGGAAGEVE